ncbi:MAG TPA: efflux RND transporter periplasmic adaptor subunit [Candidatus Polarisedimenticolia bacterium]|nr:efflux RND transporter periplasmic adaptor subunit [Candidatus Polarisedimenticolia bacterium]
MQSQTQIKAHPHKPPALRVVKGMRPSKRGWLIAGALLVVFGGIVVYGILSRHLKGNTVRAETAQMAVPSVSVVSPQRSAPSQEIVLPGNVQPFISSPIYARTNGYVKSWHADIGAHVRKGQLLAVIETPEVDQQLLQSRSNLATAQANLKLAEITKNRYQGLLATHAVAQQDADNALGTYNANKAIVEANQANVKQLETLQSFEKIYAPFDGIVTARNTDIGALINSGNSGNVKTDLFHISQPGKLRVYVNVPEQYSKAATPGLTANLTLAEFPGRQFQGKLVRTSDSINFATRTLTAEIDVDNPSGELLTGSYTEVHLNVPGQASSYLVPVSTLIFRSQGLQLAVVKNGSVSLTPVTPGRDFGEQIEIVSGLNGDESVIVSPPDSIVSGQKVQVVKAVSTGGPQ